VAAGRMKRRQYDQAGKGQEQKPAALIHEIPF
jgi:hypothetical protein